MPAVQSPDLDDAVEALAALEHYFAVVALMIAEGVAKEIDQEITEARRRKPCPFCGSEDLETKYVGDVFNPPPSVGCNECDALGPTAGGYNEAWKLWNTRK